MYFLVLHIKANDTIKHNFEFQTIFPFPLELCVTLGSHSHSSCMSRSAIRSRNILYIWPSTTSPLYAKTILAHGIYHIHKAHNKRQANQDAEKSQTRQAWTQNLTYTG